MNVMVQLEFELAYFEASVKQACHYATEIPLVREREREREREKWRETGIRVVDTP